MHAFSFLFIILDVPGDHTDHQGRHPETDWDESPTSPSPNDARHEGGLTLSVTGSAADILQNSELTLGRMMIIARGELLESGFVPPPTVSSNSPPYTAPEPPPAYTEVDPSSPAPRGRSGVRTRRRAESENSPPRRGTGIPRPPVPRAPYGRGRWRY
jgi:hypothetical protein